jgi:hypothetical protein
LISELIKQPVINKTEDQSHPVISIPELLDIFVVKNKSKKSLYRVVSSVPIFQD